MNSNLLARIGLSRLQLPIPTVKLGVVHSAAMALRNEFSKQVVWNELIYLLSESQLESEILEALCIPLLAYDADIVDAGELRAAIARPSVLSDMFTAQISNSRWAIPSWESAHSGLAPELASFDASIKELMSGSVIPPGIGRRLKSLEIRSNCPFVRQWAYEFEILVDKHKARSGSSLDYYVRGYGQRDRGIFQDSRSQLARSAYLRTLAAAYDCWGLPLDLVEGEAMHVTPSDMAFLRVLPAEPPSWLRPLLDCRPISDPDWQAFVERVKQAQNENDSDALLIHANFCLTSSSTFMAELELISCIEHGSGVTAEESFRLHNTLPGSVSLGRDYNMDIIVGPCEPPIRVKSKSGAEVYPALLPCLGEYFGYFQNDLVGRMPYLPANYSAESIYGSPRRGGLDIIQAKQKVGEMAYWNWEWRPSYDKALGPQCGVCTYLRKDICEKVLSLPGTKIRQYWQATVITAERDHGPWQESDLIGCVPR